MMATEKSPIPAEYQLVEYLSKPSGKLPYINLQILASDIDVIRYTFMVDSTAGDWNTMGASTAYTFAGGLNLSDEIYNGTYRFTAKASSTNIAAINSGVWYIATYNQGHIQLENESGTILGQSTLQVQRPTLDLFIFNRNVNGNVRTDNLYKGVNYKKVSIVTASLLNVELYPVYRKSDNKPGMYDIVNNVFYTNQGPDEFTVGPDAQWQG